MNQRVSHRSSISLQSKSLANQSQLLRSMELFSRLEDKHPYKFAPTPDSILKDKLTQVKYNNSSHVIDKLDDGFIVYYCKDKLAALKNPPTIHRNNFTNLNCKVLDRNREEIVCRHISYNRWLYPKTYQFKFSSITSIRNETNLKNNVYDTHRILYRADHYYSCVKNNLGMQLHTIINELADKNEIFIQLHSENHSMSLTIKRKAFGMIAIEFFDPNLTQTHKRGLFVNVMAIQKLQLEHLFLTKNHLEKYFPKFHSIILAVYNEPPQLKTESINHIKFSDDLNNSPEILYNALLYNDPLTITTYLSHISKPANLINKLFSCLSHSAPDSKSELLNHLALRNDNTTGLYMAMQEGHTEAITAYFAGIKQLELDPELTRQLVMADNGKITGLFIAMQQGNAKAVAAYLAGIKQLNLKPLIISQLIAATNEKTTGLIMAMQEGHTEAITAYLTGIKMFNLNSQAIIELLTIDYGKGSGLYMAMQEGNTEAITAYFAGIKQLNLPPQGIAKIVSTHKNQITCLEVAIAQDNTHALSAYFVGVANLELPKPTLNSIFKGMLSQTKFYPTYHHLKNVYISGLRLLGFAPDEIEQLMFPWQNKTL